MKIQQINSYFKRFAAFELAHRFKFLALGLALVIFSLAGLPKSSIINDSSQWFEDGDAMEVARKDFEKVFGNSQGVYILVRSKDVFDVKILKMIKNLGEDLLKNVPYADSVVSLADMDLSLANEEGMQVVNPFSDDISKSQVAKYKPLIMERKSLRNKIVNSKATQTWITLRLRPYPPSEVWSKETKLDPMFAVGEAAIKILKSPKYQSSSYKLQAVGMPYTETEERDYMKQAIPKTVVGAFLAMIFVFALLTRSFAGTLVAMSSAFVGVLSMFGLMGHLGIGINQNMISLPLLLSMAVSIAYCMHLVNAFKQALRKGGVRHDAVLSAVEETGWPLFFTALTTMGSMASFVSAGIVPIIWTGLTTAAVVGANYLIVMIFVPILLSFGKDYKASEDDTSFEKQMQGISNFIMGRKKPILAIFSLLLILAIPANFKININIDIFEMMGLKIPYVKKVYDVSTSDLGSYLSYSVGIDLKKQDAVKDPKNLQKLDTLIKEIGSFALTKKNEGVASVLSVLDILKELNQVLNEGKEEFYAIPKSREMVAQTLFLYEISGGNKLFEWINSDYSTYRINIALSNFDANEIVSEIERIKSLSSKLFPDASIKIVGAAAEFASMNERLVVAELKSVFTALVVISLLLVFVFGSFKAGLIGMIPNISPIIIIGSFMGIFGFSLDMMTMMIMPMILGIGVDDTIHFINQIKYQFEKTHSYKEAIERSFRGIGATLAMTTIILVIGFATYIMADMNTLSRLGILAPLGLLTALIMDYTLTPILIYYAKPFGKELKK